MKYIFLLFLIFALTNCCRSSRMHFSAGDRSAVDSLVTSDTSADSLMVLIDQFKKESNDHGAMIAYKQLGRIQRDNTQFSEAIVSHQYGLNYALKLEDTVEIVQAFNNLGTDFRRIGAMGEASDYHYRALEFSEAYSGSATQAGIKNRVVALNGIGNISLTLGFYDEAEIYLRSALKDEITLKSAIGQAINYANIGSIFEYRQQFDSARYYYEQSMEQNRIAKSNMGIGLCYIHYGNIFKKQGAYEAAKEEYQKAYDLMEHISDRWHWLEAGLSIAKIHLLTHNFSGFNQYITLAEKTAHEIRSPEHLSVIYQLKHDKDLTLGDFESALQNYKQSIIMQDSVQGMKKRNQFLDLRVNYERNKYNQTIRQIEDQNRAEQERREIMLYVMILTSIGGVTVTGLLYYGYRQRTRSNELLRQMEEMRSEFFTGITHEFRTPLTVILGLAEKIKNTGDNQHGAQTIIRQGHILLNMVNQLLEMAKIKSRLEKSKWVNDDIVAHVMMNVEAFRAYAATKGIDLIFSTSERTMTIDFIPKYFERIIINLLSNATKHSPQGGKVEIRLEQQEKKLIFSVTDNGKGIDTDDLPHLFKEFYVGKIYGYSESGTGIGLALVKKMVEAMNGKIIAENRIGGGARFKLTMPLKQNFEINAKLTESLVTPLTVEDATLHLVPAEMIANDEETADRPHKMSILIVEDNPDIQNYIGSLLEENYITRYASDGKEGINKAAEFLPDLIITDLMMPVMDGFELSRQVRKDNVLNHIPIIVITAKTASEDLQHALEMGADAYLHKPFDASELKLRVRKLLEQRQILREKYSKALLEGLSDEVELSNNDRDFLNRVITIIYDNIVNDKLNADFISENVYMSRSQLNRKIRQITGYSISAFVLHIRLEQAKRMLHTDNTRIGDIAMACGFEDSNYFSRMFKQVYKVTPSQFRRIPKENFTTV